MTHACHLRDGDCGVRGNLGTYGPANNRLMRSETYDTSGPTDALMSTTYYRYNAQGNVTRVINEPYRPSGGESDFTATRFIYAKNGSTVTYVMGETWDEGETCPENYTITYGREFRYDGPRARYLSRELDTTALLSGSFVPVSDTWTDYDGDIAYGDFTIDGITVTDGMWYEPGIARSASAQDRATAAYYHADLIGTTRDVSVAGASTAPATYTAFGEQVSGTAQRYGYAGAYGYQTDDTGAFPYQHVGARYYNATTGRFLQRDPIGLVGGANVYAYVDSAPASSVDPQGLWNDPSGPYAGCGFGGPCGPGKPKPSSSNSRPPKKPKPSSSNSRPPKKPRPPRNPHWPHPAPFPKNPIPTNWIEDYVPLVLDEVLCVGVGLLNKITNLIRISYMGEPNGGNFCFVSGTLVHTESGIATIETLRPGARVLSRDTEAHQATRATVVDTVESWTEQLVTIAVDGEVVTCTPEHPFWVVDKGWTLAGKLRKGDLLQNAGGAPVHVVGVTRERPIESSRVHGITVSAAHTYYVGRSGLLVHNKPR